MNAFCWITEPKLPEETDNAEDSKEPADEEKEKEKDADVDSSDEEGEGDVDNEKPEEMDVDETGEEQEENHPPDSGKRFLTDWIDSRLKQTASFNIFK